MGNYVSTRTNLSDKDEETTVDVFRNLMRARHLLHQKASDVARSVGLHAAEMNDGKTISPPSTSETPSPTHGLTIGASQVMMARNPVPTFQLSLDLKRRTLVLYAA